MLYQDLVHQLQNALAECERLRIENTHLRSLLQMEPENSSVEEKVNVSELVPELLSVKEKIILFCSLFRGRDDVYAVRWESKNGKTGYSPALGNQWNPYRCKKPKIRCAICNQEKLLPLTDQVVYDHLSGKHMIGIYPLLSDETCWFLAIDFDKAGWQEDAIVFQAVANNFSVPTALERSQSGNGAHCWIFFEQAIPAYLARQLGCALLTQTMRERHQLNLSSYDRLFPNQDTMPKGGFGNLIALPLQGARRKAGNSVFLDETLQPYSDQWAFLASVKKMSYQAVSALVQLLADKNGIIDVRKSQVEETTENDPWVASAKKPAKLTITTPLPASIPVTIANLVYIEITDLPRGCLQEVSTLLTEYNVKTTLTDETYTGQAIDVEFSGQLYPQQQKAADELLKHANGVLVATTAFGKTVVGAWMIAQRKINTLILVYRQQLMEQWRERLALFLNILAKEIGTIGGGKQQPIGKILLCCKAYKAPLYY